MPTNTNDAGRLMGAMASKWSGREGYGEAGVVRYNQLGYKVKPSDTKGYVYVDMKEMERSMREVETQLRKSLGKHFSDEALMEVYMECGEMFQKEMRTTAPQAKRAYSKGKRLLTNRAKVRDGQFREARDIQLPGNLRRSITVFPGNKSNGPAVYIGPRRKKAKFGDKKADGFYGYWQAYGARHMKKGHPTHNDFVMKAYRNKHGAVIQKLMADINKKTTKVDRELNGAGT